MARGLWRAAALSIAALGVGAVIVTFSRSGFLALVVIAFLYLWRAKGGGRLLAVAAALVVVLALPIVAPAGYVDRIGSVTNWEADRSGSAENRWRDMVAATGFVVTHPMFGAGIGMDFLALNTMRGNAWLPVHNAYLGYAVDLGLPGLALFVALLVACVRGVARVEREAGRRDPVGHLAGALRISLVAFAIAASFYPISYHPFFYYLAGLGVAAQRIHASEARAA
jgi:O-antigen ligase